MKEKPSCQVCGMNKVASVHVGYGDDKHEYEAPGRSQKPRPRLQPRSQRREQFYAEVYRPLTRDVVGDGNKPCPVKSPHCTGKIEGVHEILPRGRAGGLEAALRDGPTLGTCHACNSFISQNPKWAEDAGLLRHAR